MINQITNQIPNQIPAMKRRNELLENLRDDGKVVENYAFGRSAYYGAVVKAGKNILAAIPLLPTEEDRKSLYELYINLRKQCDERHAKLKESPQETPQEASLEVFV